MKVGRVQTPTLAMLVEREEKIRNFKKEQYYMAHILMDGIDAATERVDDKAQAESIAAACESKAATVLSVTKEKKTVQPPKLYDLTTLQRDDYIDMEAMRDIDRHEAEVFSRFEGGGMPDFYYAISLTSDALAGSYCISVMDGSTGEEIQPYRDSHGDMPTFETVDEAVDYCHRNGIDFENAKEVDQWHIIDVERTKAAPGGQVQREDAEKPLTADDIQNLVLTNREYFAGSRTTVSKPPFL